MCEHTELHRATLQFSNLDQTPSLIDGLLQVLMAHLELYEESKRRSQ